jgi:DNA-binding PucR family transcriptional regulator
MTATRRTPPLCTLGAVLSELGPEASLIGDYAEWIDHPVAGAVVWVPEDPVPSPTDVLLVCPGGVVQLSELTPLLDDTARIIAVPTPPDSAQRAQLVELGVQHAIVVVGDGANIADVVVAVARATLGAEEAVSRRLVALQRAFSQELAAAAPVEALMNRLKKVTNATVVLIDRRGDPLHATGPTPLSLLFSEIGKTTAESQTIDVDGWHGVATRIVDADAPDEHLGWLLAAARRVDFPDPYAISAVHIAGTLIEATQRMSVVRRAQEQAVRASVLEQALGMRPIRDNPEVAERIAGLGLAFGDPLRAAAFRPARTPARATEDDVVDALLEEIAVLAKTAGIASLVMTRDRGVAALMQTSADQIAHLARRSSIELHVGAGREINTVGDIVDSYHDAQLAVRTLRRNGVAGAFMSYEEFDFATALFSDIGLDTMVARAEQFLAPLADRDVLLEGLFAYFEHNQNIITAAQHLNIHHNSLRYRLAKVESALDIDLKEPGAISSTFLALTAIDLGGRAQWRGLRLHGRVAPASGVGDVEAPSTATTFTGAPAAGGVVYGANS